MALMPNIKISCLTKSTSHRFAALVKKVGKGFLYGNSQGR